MLISVIFSFVCCISSVHPSKILAIFPFPAKSHYAIPDPLLVRLAERGHEVTVYTPYLKRRPIPNYTEVDTSQCFLPPDHSLDLNEMKEKAANRFSRLWSWFTYVTIYEDLVECEPLLKLFSSTDQHKFDLLITETFNTDVLLVFAVRFQTPFITVHTNVLTPWMSRSMGIPHNPSYLPGIQDEFLFRRSFWQRVTNTVVYLVALILYDTISLRTSDSSARYLFRESWNGSLYDVSKRCSILFANSHPSVNVRMPLVPGVVEIGGIHIRNASVLPEVCWIYLISSRWLVEGKWRRESRIRYCVQTGNK